MAKYDLTIREEELKNLVRDDWFGKYDGNKIIGNIDLSVCVPTEPGQLELFDLDFFLWAEAKKGNKEDIDDSLVQLIITIMKARTYNDYMPPLYLAAFDAEKIAFIPYDDKLQRQVIFDPILENNIDWTKITPSDHNTEDFALVKKKAKDILPGKIIFDFVKEEKELRQFIKSNFVVAKAGTNKINITLNRMTSIFNRWLEIVKPTIKAPWTDLAKENILPADFFLADVISKNNQSLGESLQVLLRSNSYRMKLKMKIGTLYQDVYSKEVEFTDKQKAHKTFWNKYNRPPRRKERLLMQERRDLLVEPDRRERKGAFFTPYQWVDLSREYLAKVLKENWQQEYYVWDCCAGTGNLLFGLTEKERIFASTLDEADVTYMRSQKNLLSAHVFQFDFLNDDLQGDKVPDDLKRILKDPERRKKLIIYINPPYAEASGFGEKCKPNVSSGTKVYAQYKGQIGAAIKELFAQFFIRIYKEIPGVTLAEFSTLKILQAPTFANFRSIFKAKLLSLFIVPADTFDNVKGQFPIGFYIWDTKQEERYTSFEADVYDNKGIYIQKKKTEVVYEEKLINKWLRANYDKKGEPIAFLRFVPNDFQSNRGVYITLSPKESDIRESRITPITKNNLVVISIYNSVRKVIPATWLNDRDQFLYPRNAWKGDREFQSDCLVYSLFYTNIQSPMGTNHWIPFTEKEVDAPMLFESNFMSDFIAGNIKPDVQDTLFDVEESFIPFEPIQFSPEAQALLDAGRELWKYYMTKNDELNFNVNASYYDIRRYFQGEKNEKMNAESDDKTYMRLWNNIKEAQKVLAAKIAQKVYLYGFLLDETTLPEDEPSIEEPQEQKPAKPTKKATKKRKPSSQPVEVHYHIEHIDTLNIGDNVENKFS